MLKDKLKNKRTKKSREIGKLKNKNVIIIVKKE